MSHLVMAFNRVAEGGKEDKMDMADITGHNDDAEE